VAEVLQRTVNEIWDKYDVDGNGYLDRAELKRFVDDVFKEIKADIKDVKSGDYDTIFAELD